MEEKKQLEIEVIENLIKSDMATVTMYRIRYNGKRGYVTLKPFKLYSGLTGALSSATFKGSSENKRNEGWRDSMIRHLGSQEEFEKYFSSLGDFGTINHEVLVRIKENGCLDWTFERENARKYFMQSAHTNGITPNLDVIEKQVFEFCKSASSLMQFVYDNVISIKAIESMCFDDELQIATPIDLVCEVKKAGLVSINLKTSKQFSEGHWEQVAIEKYLWNNTYPDHQVAQTGLFRAKDWMIKKGVPTYEFELLKKDEEKPILEDTLKRLMLCKGSANSTYYTFPTIINTFDGVTKAGEPPKVMQKSLEDVIKESFEA